MVVFLLALTHAPSSNRARGLEISHLLSGAKQEFKLKNGKHEALIEQSNRAKYLNYIEQALFSLQITDPLDAQNKAITEVKDYRKVFWWLWRCLPVATCQLFGNDASLHLMPAETRLPDSSIWSHVSLTSALAGALAGSDWEHLTFANTGVSEGR